MVGLSTVVELVACLRCGSMTSYGERVIDKYAVTNIRFFFGGRSYGPRHGMYVAVLVLTHCLGGNGFEVSGFTGGALAVIVVFALFRLCS